MGVYLSQPITDKITHSDSNSSFRYTSCEMQGWRKFMEDAKITCLELNSNGKTYSVFGVFDGHGGAEVSAFVEKNFIQELTKNQQFRKGNIKEALEQNFRRMDQMIENDPILSLENAGCTANVVVIDEENYYTANSGDSRSVLCRAGKIVSLSEDHKPQCQIQRKRIEGAGGSIINGRVNGGLNLTRAIGDLEYKKVTHLGYKEQMITCHPDVKIVPRDSQDEFILMGCDGICQPLIDIVGEHRKKQKDTKVLMEELLDSLLAKSTFEEVGCDNMTAILVDILKK